MELLRSVLFAEYFLELGVLVWLTMILLLRFNPQSSIHNRFMFGLTRGDLLVSLTAFALVCVALLLLAIRGVPAEIKINASLVLGLIAGYAVKACFDRFLESRLKRE